MCKARDTNDQEIDFVAIVKREKELAARRSKATATLVNLHTILANNMMEQDFILGLIDEINDQVARYDENE